MSEATVIPGPAGDLEALVTRAGGGRRWAILCHPHPLMGGTMHDAVVGIAAGALASLGWSTLRFNFRGAGASGGEHDGGVGEVDDLLAVHAWLVREHEPSALLLGGYSFGSNVVWQAQGKLDNVEHVLLVAPVVTHMDYSAPANAAQTHVITGGADAFVDLGALQAWADGRFGITVIPGADHFFQAGADALQQAVCEIGDE